MLTDSHLHLEDQNQIKKAKEIGILRFFNASASPNEWQKVLDLSLRCPEIVPFIGTHPWYAQEHDPEKLEQILKDNKSVQVGEIGLDAVRSTQSQYDVFTSQLKLADQFNRVCVIHCVRDFPRMFRAISKHQGCILMHAFSGGIEEMKFLLKKGAYFSFSFPLSVKQGRIVKEIPVTNLLIESDYPRTNFLDLRLIVTSIADIKGITEQELSRILELNAQHYLKVNK